MGRIKRAILSVYNKEGIVEFALGLNTLSVEILSTGGTYRLLKDAGIPVKEVSEETGFPEMLGGRVKTLHPRIHGGILGKRDDPKHVEQMAQQEITAIDLVVVNLYPFAETIAKPDVTLDEAIEQIDIGGPAMLRSAAKNYKDVAVICDPADYTSILDEMKQADGAVSIESKARLSKKVFQSTASYDRAIFSYLDGLDPSLEIKEEVLPDTLSLQFQKVQSLRYGENPHQKAALYQASGQVAGHASNLKQLWGKEMSYNNFLDMDAAFELVRGFEKTTAVVVKHSNPCGVATAESLVEAYCKARATDPLSAFGGVAAFNRPVDVETAKEIVTTFMEVVIAPAVDPEALAVFKKKKNLRIIEVGQVIEAGNDASPVASLGRLDLRPLSSGLLVQEHDDKVISDPAVLKVVSARVPTEREMEALLFSWRVCKQVKSNAIIFAKPGQTIGIGAGQMSRVDSVKIATLKAQFPIKGCVMASDAFFPFRDAIDTAAESGITAVIQPGGSIRDDEVIAAINEHNMAMVFTGMRHFKH